MLIDAGPGGSPDGFRVDVDGNLWCGWGMGKAELDGVRIFNQDGKPIGHIDLPERCANLCFGGRHRNRLFMTASHSLYALYVNTQGAPAADQSMPSVNASGVDSSYSWWRLVASVTLSTVGGIGMWCLVVALPALQHDLGVSRADISFAYTMNTLGFFAGGVTWGYVVDRRGIVVTSILSAIGLAAGFALASTAPSLTLVAAAQALIGFSAAATFAPLVADISHWFEKRRGVAVAIAASGNYLAGAVWPPIIELLIRDHGWRVTYWVAAALCLVTMVPLALMLRRKPPQHHTASGASTAGVAPYSPRSLGLSPECPAGGPHRGRHRLLRRHVDAPGPYRGLLRRPRLRHGARRRPCCR